MQTPKARIEQAVALRRVGDIEDALSNHEQTERIYRQVIDLLDELADPPLNDPRRREELATMHFKLAWLYVIDGRTAEAARHYTEALEIYQALATAVPRSNRVPRRTSSVFDGLGNDTLALGQVGRSRTPLFARTPNLRILGDATGGSSPIHPGSAVVLVITWASSVVPPVDCWNLNTTGAERSSFRPKPSGTLQCPHARDMSMQAS